MRFTPAAPSEAALAAHFEYLCALKGSDRPAYISIVHLLQLLTHGVSCSYVPVVASGSNALVIHYTANDHRLRPDDLILMDAGCEFK